MKNITLRIINGNKVENLVLNSGKAVTKKATAGTQYQLVNENGQLISHVKTKVVGNDLVVFVEGVEQPTLILEEYQLHYPIENIEYLADAQASFATAENAAIASELSSTVSTSVVSSLSAAQVAGIGLGALAVVGTGIAVVGKSSSSHSNNNQSSQSTEKASGSTTQPTVPVTPPTDTNTGSSEQPTVPVTPPAEPLKPEISLDPIATDDVIDVLEAQATTITVSGSAKNVKDGDSVSLIIGEATFNTVVKDGKFSVAVDTKTLVVHQSIEAQVTTQDEVGNTATAETSGQYTLDKVTYVPQVTIDQITADNTINIKESGETVAIQGSVTDAPNGSVVTIVIGDQTLTGTVTDGRFTVDTSGELLAKNRELQVSVVTAQNLTGSTTHTYEVDLEAPTLKINLNPISGDNHISTAESKQEFTTVTGTVDGASEGDEVVVSCGCLTCSGVQWVDMVTTVKNGGFSVDFKTVDLLKANYNIVKASVTTKDAAENSATAEDSETYTQPTPLQIDITKIDDFSFNLADVDPLVRIKGAVELEGNYATGMNDRRLHQVDVTIGGKVYSVGFHNRDC